MTNNELLSRAGLSEEEIATLKDLRKKTAKYAGKLASGEQLTEAEAVQLRALEGIIAKARKLVDLTGDLTSAATWKDFARLWRSQISADA